MQSREWCICSQDSTQATLHMSKKDRSLTSPEILTKLPEKQAQTLEEHPGGSATINQIQSHLKTLMCGSLHLQLKKNPNPLRELARILLILPIITSEIARTSLREGKKDKMVKREAFFLNDTQMETVLIPILLKCSRERWWIKVLILHLMILLSLTQRKGFFNKLFYFH